ncbi:MAG: hypothetical protein ACHQQQ_01825 [Bacteroidota bacterium]
MKIIPIRPELKNELQGNKGLIQKVKKKYLPTGEKLAGVAWKNVSFRHQKLTRENVIKNFNAYLSELLD